MNTERHSRATKLFRLDKRRNPSLIQKLCFKFVKAHCLLCGVDLTFSGSFTYFLMDLHPRAVVLLLIRLFGITMLILSCIGKAIRTYHAFPNHASTNDIFQVLYVVVSYAMFSEAVRIFWLRQELLKKLLHANYFNVRYVDVRRFSVWIFCWLFWVYLDIESAIGNKDSRTLPQVSPPVLLTGTLKVFDKIGNWCNLYVWQLQYNVFLLFLLGPSIVYGQLVDLEACIRSIQLSNIISMKNNIRDTTSCFNRAFNTLLLIMYIKIFSLVYRALIIILQFRSSSRTARMMLITPCLQISIVYDMACVGTKIIRCCHSTAQNILLERKNLSYDELWILSRLVYFNRDQDALSILGSFINQKRTLVTYFGTIIKFISVVLQFDYRLMAMFDRYKRYVNFISSIVE